MKAPIKRLRKASVAVLALLGFMHTSSAMGVVEDGFESGEISHVLWQQDTGSDCAIGFVKEPIRSGELALQFRASNNARCELVPHTVRGRFGELKRKFIREPYHQDRWYVFSTFLHGPWKYDDSNEVLAQWHASPDPIIANEHGRGPPLALRVTKDYFRISYGWDSAFRSTKKHIAKYTLWYDSLETEQWIDWVFHVRWSYENDGLIRIWKNRELIVDYNGPNAYNDLRGVYLKLGIYHPRPERTVTFDDVYIDDTPPDVFRKFLQTQE